MEILTLLAATAAIVLLCTAVHEAGHAAAALLLGLPVKRFRIGSGPLLASVRTRCGPLEIRALPVGGAVDIDDNALQLPGMRAAIAMTALAGPAASLLAGALAALTSLQTVTATISAAIQTGPAAGHAMLLGAARLAMQGNFQAAVAIVSITLGTANGLAPIPPADLSRAIMCLLRQPISPRTLALADRAGTVIWAMIAAAATLVTPAALATMR